MRTWSLSLSLSLSLTGCLLSADDYDHDDDNDGVPSAEDCDDSDPELGAQVYDRDCDGILTVEDCDDADDSMPKDDADCDGVLTADDCDDVRDSDPKLGAQVYDRDCDGILTAEDCDDSDPLLPASIEDLDCDGWPTPLSGGELVRIGAQSFTMGCTDGQSDCDVGDERPVMPVELTHAYYLGATEVTQDEYERVMGEQAASLTTCGPDCPVESVTWHMAAAFTNALSSWAGLGKCYDCSGSGLETDCSPAQEHESRGLEPTDCHGYRLPTEAEWEGAARCGFDLLYAGSNSASSVGWYEDNSTTLRPVRGLQPNACGLYDMSGNAWEWTHDWYADDAYVSSGVTDPFGPDHGTSRVRRGGGWTSSASQLRVADRDFHVPTYRNYNLGFRIARTIPWQSELLDAH